MKIRILIVSDSKKMPNLNLLQLGYRTQAFVAFFNAPKLKIDSKSSIWRALKCFFWGHGKRDLDIKKLFGTRYAWSRGAPRGGRGGDRDLGDWQIGKKGTLFDSILKESQKLPKTGPWNCKKRHISAKNAINCPFDPLFWVFWGVKWVIFCFF